ncbi:hypothetical protein [Thermoanaerobacter wiegelii]|uniref:Uncharacterized protein n=1 Tax=Thermoanaerobacter wiegelii Rt8.B1 TaxID=697303 RepID=G2MVI8_9THEO|nr:hypothetical protein [Thermoanaerobacter wiegelii]AEM79116.1 hypothetical protein Thewi_1721 [Thermoanaerobacter wiegelii Rt8.B1]
MKWNYLVAGISFSILAIIRFIYYKDILIALLFCLGGIFYLYRFYKSAIFKKKTHNIASNSEFKSKAITSYKPTKEQLMDYIDLNKKIARNWLILSLVATGIIVANFLFLRYFPLSIVMMLIGIYCTLRYRNTIYMINKAKLALNNLDE